MHPVRPSPVVRSSEILRPPKDLELRHTVLTHTLGHSSRLYAFTTDTGHGVTTPCGPFPVGVGEKGVSCVRHVSACRRARTYVCENLRTHSLLCSEAMRSVVSFETRRSREFRRQIRTESPGSVPPVLGRYTTRNSVQKTTLRRSRVSSPGARGNGRPSGTPRTTGHPSRSAGPSSVMGG